MRGASASHSLLHHPTHLLHPLTPLLTLTLLLLLLLALLGLLGLGGRAVEDVLHRREGVELAVKQVNDGQLVLSKSLANPQKMVQIAMAVKDVAYEDIVFVQYPTVYAEGGLRGPLHHVRSRALLLRRGGSMPPKDGRHSLSGI